jgi:glycine reductase complex component B subunit alpha and beta
MTSISLERATYSATDVVAGSMTAWQRGTLTLDIDGIAASVRSRQGIRDVAIHVTRPGDSARIVDALDVVMPMHKPGATTFPGLLGPAGPCGDGRTDVIDGVAVISTARLDPDPEAVPSIIDLAGPGAHATPWSKTFNVVLTFTPDPAAEAAVVERAIRLSTIQVARDLAAAVEGHEPDRVEHLTRANGRTSLPGICAVISLASEGVMQDTYVHGMPFHGPPRLIDPLEVLDGSIVSGAYTQPGTRQPTYFYQRNELIERLLAMHGTSLRFCGVVLTEAYLDDTAAKEEMAARAVELALETGASGAVITTYGGGNSHTDVMLVCRAAERRGLRTSILLAETNSGLTDHVPEADCIVSVGNEDELVPEWHPDLLIGGDTLPDGRSAADAGPLSYLAYLGSVTQTGDLRLRAAPA